MFYPATFVCLCKVRTSISNAILRGVYYVQWLDVKGCCSFVHVLLLANLLLTSRPLGQFCI
jgi:hypothetical protein